MDISAERRHIGSPWYACHNRAGLSAPLIIAPLSLGYKSTPLEGAPFDAKRCVVPNQGGVVVEEQQQGGARMYCSGWVKRGPTGVILSTMNDAFETADSIAHDLADGKIPPATANDLAQLLADRNVRLDSVSVASVSSLPLESLLVGLISQLPSPFRLWPSTDSKRFSSARSSHLAPSCIVSLFPAPTGEAGELRALATNRSGRGRGWQDARQGRGEDRRHSQDAGNRPRRCLIWPRTISVASWGGLAACRAH